MEKALSEIFQTSGKFPSGKTFIPTALLFDTESGKVTGIKACRHFFPVENLLWTEGSLRLSKETAGEHSGTNWLKFRVANRRGKNLGRVAEIWCDTQVWCVTKFSCVKKFLGHKFGARIFAADLIFEVLPEKKLIVVEDENRVFRREMLPLPKLGVFTEGA